MNRLALLGIPLLWLASAACGGSTPPDEETSEPTAPSDQGTPESPSMPPDQGAPESPNTPPDHAPSEPPNTTPDQPTAKHVVHIDCAPVNDFGYIGWAKGDLEIGGRSEDGAFTVRGGLQLRYKLIDEPETTKEVQVEGTIDKYGEYVSARVMSGAEDLESVLFVLANRAASAINSPNGGPAYQTHCGASTADIPQGSDLKPEGSMTFYVLGDGTIGVHLNVVNIGNQPTSSARGRVMIGASTADAELHRGTDGDDTDPMVNLNPGERGYIRVALPPNALARCMHPRVVIDLDHTFQAGAPDPFANDTGEVWTQCMTWSRPISADSVDSRRFDPTDPFLIGKTLGNIVGGSEVGRKDGRRCSECHYKESGNRYSPPVEKDGSGTIDPTLQIGDTTWAASDGWVRRFQTNPIGKPDYLKAALQQWIDDGARP